MGEAAAPEFDAIAEKTVELRPSFVTTPHGASLAAEVIVLICFVQLRTWLCRGVGRANRQPYFGPFLGQKPSTSDTNTSLFRE